MLHKIKSTRRISELKSEVKMNTTKKYDTLVKNKLFLFHSKFSSDKKRSIILFINIHPKVTLLDTIYKKVQDKVI